MPEQRHSACVRTGRSFAALVVLLAGCGGGDNEKSDLVTAGVSAGRDPVKIVGSGGIFTREVDRSRRRVPVWVFVSHCYDADGDGAADRGRQLDRVEVEESPTEVTVTAWVHVDNVDSCTLEELSVRRTATLTRPLGQKRLISGHDGDVISYPRRSASWNDATFLACSVHHENGQTQPWSCPHEKELRFSITAEGWASSIRRLKRQGLVRTHKIYREDFFLTRKGRRLVGPATRPTLKATVRTLRADLIRR